MNSRATMSSLTARQRHHDLIVIGGSAGALEALRQIVGKLPRRLPAAMCVVIHTSATSARLLAAILERSGPLPASYPTDGEPIVPGRIYVASPDHHLLIERSTLRVTKGPKENRFRPAVDPLFRTAAHTFGSRVIGVILSGGDGDGTLGLAAVARAGGVTIAQSPDDAIVTGMPASAIEFADVDHVLPADEIPALLSRLVGDSGTKAMVQKGKPKLKSTAGRRQKPDTAEAGGALSPAGVGTRKPPSIFICPECGGPLWESEENGLLRYHCHVGHAFTAEAFVGAQADALEQALWTALRSLEEGAALRRRMAAHARGRGLAAIAERFDDDGDDLEQRAAMVRKALVVEDVPTNKDRPAVIEERARQAAKR